MVVGAFVATTLALVSSPVPATPSPSALAGSAASLPPAVTGTPGVSPSGVAATSDASPGPSRSSPPVGPTSPVGATPPPSAPARSVPIDPSLLSVLPVQVGGIRLTPDPDTAARVAADPAHSGDLAALAVAVAVDPGSGDLAVASVVRVLPGVYSDAYFDDWRATFDAGACAQAGGAGSTSKTTIAGHAAFIGHCAGGLVTYHVHLTGDDRIVSITSVGAGRLGQLIVEGLR